jgi:hypothetical protein
MDSIEAHSRVTETYHSIDDDQQNEEEEQEQENQQSDENEYSNPYSMAVEVRNTNKFRSYLFLAPNINPSEAHTFFTDKIEALNSLIFMGG